MIKPLQLRTVASPITAAPVSFEFDPEVPPEDQDAQMASHLLGLRATQDAQDMGTVPALGRFLAQAQAMAQQAKERPEGPRVIRQAAPWGLTPEQANQTYQTIAQDAQQQQELEMRRQESLAARKQALAVADQELQLRHQEMTFNGRLKGIEHQFRLDEIRQKGEIDKEVATKRAGEKGSWQKTVDANGDVRWTLMTKENSGKMLADTPSEEPVPVLKLGSDGKPLIMNGQPVQEYVPRSEAAGRILAPDVAPADNPENTARKQGSDDKEYARSIIADANAFATRMQASNMMDVTTGKPVTRSQFLRDYYTQFGDGLPESLASMAMASPTELEAAHEGVGAGEEGPVSAGTGAAGAAGAGGGSGPRMSAAGATDPSAIPYGAKPGGYFPISDMHWDEASQRMVPGKDNSKARIDGLRKDASFYQRKANDLTKQVTDLTVLLDPKGPVGLEDFESTQDPADDPRLKPENKEYYAVADKLEFLQKEANLAYEKAESLMDAVAGNNDTPYLTDNMIDEDDSPPPGFVEVTIGGVRGWAPAPAVTPAK